MLLWGSKVPRYALGFIRRHTEFFCQILYELNWVLNGHIKEFIVRSNYKTWTITFNELSRSKAI